MKHSEKTHTTPAEVADLVEFAINESKPDVKTKRGVNGEIEIAVGQRKFIIEVSTFLKKRTVAACRVNGEKAAARSRKQA